jgi:hypothetical protein
MADAVTRNYRLVISASGVEIVDEGIDILGPMMNSLPGELIFSHIIPPLLASQLSRSHRNRCGLLFASRITKIKIPIDWLDMYGHPVGIFCLIPIVRNSDDRMCTLFCQLHYESPRISPWGCRRFFYGIYSVFDPYGNVIVQKEINDLTLVRLDCLYGNGKNLREEIHRLVVIEGSIYHNYTVEPEHRTISGGAEYDVRYDERTTSEVLRSVVSERCGGREDLSQLCDEKAHSLLSARWVDLDRINETINTTIAQYKISAAPW